MANQNHLQRTHITDKNGVATSRNKKTGSTTPVPNFQFGKSRMINPAPLRPSQQQAAIEEWSEATYSKEGTLTYRNADGLPHRIGEPAVVYSNGTTERWENGVMVSRAMPGLIDGAGQMVYRDNRGRLNSFDGPSIEKAPSGSDRGRADYYLLGEARTKAQWEVERHLSIGDIEARHAAEKTAKTNADAPAGLVATQLVDVNGNLVTRYVNPNSIESIPTTIHSKVESARSAENRLDFKPEPVVEWDERGMNVKTGKPFDENGKTATGVEVSDVAMNSWEDDDELVDGVDSLGFDWTTGRHELTEREKLAALMGPEALTLSQNGVKPSKITSPDELYEALEAVSHSGISSEESRIQRGVIAAEANRNAATNARGKLVELREQAEDVIAIGAADNPRGRELLRHVDAEIAKVDRQIEKHTSEIDGLHTERERRLEG
ncbi:hypothetical protein ACVXZ4_04235 [Lacisediminihabitans sp. FW035]